MSVEHAEGYQPVLTVSEAAREMVLALRSEEEDPSSLALWVEVNGESGSSYTYDIYFEAVKDASASDAVQHSDDLPVVIPELSVEKMNGATLDVVDGGLAILNPNGPVVPPEADLTSDVAQAVIDVLENQINPSIASHGGQASLVAVEDGTAYLRLGGGCQGCGMASVTLSQGIEVAIKDAVPEITAVVDVTDHARGSNPYYQPAKK